LLSQLCHSLANGYHREQLRSKLRAFVQCCVYRKHAHPVPSVCEPNSPLIGVTLERGYNPKERLLKDYIYGAVSSNTQNSAI